MHLAMIPKLEAREALKARTIVAMGSGAMEKEDFDRIIGEWQEQAAWPLVISDAPDQKPRARFNLAAIAAAGIGVRGVKS